MPVHDVELKSKGFPLNPQFLHTFFVELTPIKTPESMVPMNIFLLPHRGQA
jgi:hypothetical protein